MNSKLIFVVAFIAIFLGVASMVGVFTPDQRTAATAQPKPKPEPQVSFWRAQRNLKPGQIVRASDFQQVQLPLSQARQQGMNRSIAFKYEARMVPRQMIHVKQVVNNALFALPSSDDYISLVTPKNHVAYPIQADDSDLKVMGIQAGQKIDVMLLSAPGGNVNVESSSYNHTGNLSVSMLFHKVKVIRVNHGSDKNQSVVLVALTQEQVAQLLIAKRIGKVFVFHSSQGIAKKYRDVAVRDVLPSYHAVQELRGSARN